MLYADYAQYSRYGSGSVPSGEFEKLADRASQWIDYVTFGRITPDKVTEKINRCCVEIVDYLYASAQFIVEGKGVVTSETVDKWRVSYAIPASMSPNNPDAAMMDICRKWLTRPTNLLYMGD